MIVQQHWDLKNESNGRIASRLEAIATRVEAIATWVSLTQVLISFLYFSLVCVCNRSSTACMLFIQVPLGKSWGPSNPETLGR